MASRHMLPATCTLTSIAKPPSVCPSHCHQAFRLSPFSPAKAIAASRRSSPFLPSSSRILKTEITKRKIYGFRVRSSEKQQSVHEIAGDAASEKAVEGPAEVCDAAIGGWKQVDEKSVGKVEKQVDCASEASGPKTNKEMHGTENLAPCAGSQLEGTVRDSETKADKSVRDVPLEKVEGLKGVQDDTREDQKKIDEKCVGKIEKEAEAVSEVASEENPKEERKVEHTMPFAGSSVEESSKDSQMKGEEIIKSVVSEKGVESPKHVHDAAREENLGKVEEQAKDVSEVASGENPLFQKAVDVASAFAVESPKEVHHEAIRKAEDIAPLVLSSVEETARDLERKAEEIADHEVEVLESDLEGNSRKPAFNQVQNYEDINDAQDTGYFSGEPRVDGKANEDQARGGMANILTHDEKTGKLKVNNKPAKDWEKSNTKDVPILQKAQSHDDKIDKARMDSNTTRDEEREGTDDVCTLEEAQNCTEAAESSTIRQDAKEPFVEEISRNVEEEMKKLQWIVESIITSGAYTRRGFEVVKGAVQKRARGFREAAEMVREACAKAAEVTVWSWERTAKHREEVQQVVSRNWEQLQKSMEAKIGDEREDMHVNGGEGHLASSYGVDEAAKETGKANSGGIEGIKQTAAHAEVTSEIGESRF